MLKEIRFLHAGQKFSYEGNEYFVKKDINKDIDFEFVEAIQLNDGKLIKFWHAVIVKPINDEGRIQYLDLQEEEQKWYLD